LPASRPTLSILTEMSVVTVAGVEADPCHLREMSAVTVVGVEVGHCRAERE
jgi:hypothetical protein